jgi:hypothetical protein
MPSTNPKFAGIPNDASGTITAGGASQQVLPANGNRQWLFIQNVDAAAGADLWVRFGAAASAGAGSIRLAPGVMLNLDGSYVPTESVQVFGATTSKPFTVLEG